MRASEFTNEGFKKNATLAALIAALSAEPAHADSEYSTIQQDPTIAQKALIILRSINKMKNYGAAGLEGEARQEFNNLMRSLQGMPNQSKVYPIVKDLIQNQDEPLPPLQEPVNEGEHADVIQAFHAETPDLKYNRKTGEYELRRLNANPNLVLHKDGRFKELTDAGIEYIKKYMQLDESEARLDPEVEEFLGGLTPDDVGKDTIGDYVVHYEGFTDQCQDTKEYQDDPEAVFDQVWSDFRKRMGDRDPVNYGIVGEHDYPIVYSVFRR
jgi:hypothetical protein